MVPLVNFRPLLNPFLVSVNSALFEQLVVALLSEHLKQASVNNALFRQQEFVFLPHSVRTIKLHKFVIFRAQFRDVQLFRIKDSLQSVDLISRLFNQFVLLF